MLNQHEVKAHNMKVALAEANRKVDSIANANADADRRAKKLDAKIKAGKQLPITDPRNRPARKIYMGGKTVRFAAANISSVMPTNTETRNREVVGITNFARASRVPQNAICMDKVAAYLKTR